MYGIQIGVLVAGGSSHGQKSFIDEGKDQIQISQPMASP
jgi:hypothetical protein